MPNLVSGNRFLRILNSFSPTMIFLLLIIFLLSTLLFWVLFFYLPVDLELKQEKVFYKNYLARKDIYQKTLASCKNIENENKELCARFKKICEKKFVSQEILDGILIALKKNNLSCSELVPKESKKSDLFDKEDYFLKAKGKFLNMLSFISDINEFGCIKIKELEFLKNKKGKVLLNAKIQLALFKI
jgi:hypothetical protein